MKKFILFEIKESDKKKGHYMMVASLPNDGHAVIKKVDGFETLDDVYEYIENYRTGSIEDGVYAGEGEYEVVEDFPKGHEILKRIRNYEGVTQAEMARVIGTTTATYQRKESGASGDFTITEGKKIAKRLNRTLDELFPEDL